MTVYTFVHKKTREIIRCHHFDGADPEFSRKYYFTQENFGSLWFVEDMNHINFIIENKDFIHPQYTMDYEIPAVDYVDVDDYEVVKFKLMND